MDRDEVTAPTLTSRNQPNFGLLFTTLHSLVHSACNHHPGIVLVLLLCVMGSTDAQAQSVCSVESSSCDLQSDDRCLARFYACGNYHTIVETLYAEEVAPSRQQLYFVGASLYGLHIRSRSRGLQCEYVKSAREYLQDYLNQQSMEFSRLGSFGSVTTMNQIYHATRMHEDLKSETGCLESAYTRSAVMGMATAEAIHLSKNVFLNPGDDLADQFDTLVMSLRGFVSMASDLETGIALRRIEIVSGSNHLNNIASLFEEVFGTVTFTETSVDIDTRTLDQLEQFSAAKMQAVALQEDEFSQVIGGISGEEYARIRQQNVSNAQSLLQQSAFHINMTGEVMPSDTDKPFWRLWEATHSPGDERAAFDNLHAIKAQWREFGISAGLCAGSAQPARKWYCRP